MALSASLGWLSCATGQTCRSGPAECTRSRQALRCEVEVGLGEENGQCTVKRLDKQTDKKEFATHQVQICIGDTLTWAFVSECASDVTVEIANFRLTEDVAKRLEREVPGIRTELREPPFRDLGQVLVRRGRAALLTTLVRTPYAPSTFKYDIIQTGPGGRHVLVDPEAEIYR
jgi:hypothetical protein